MDERPDNHMELITADGHHVANVAPTLPLVFRGTRVFLRVEGLRNVRNGSCRGLDAQRVFG